MEEEINGDGVDEETNVGKEKVLVKECAGAGGPEADGASKAELLEGILVGAADMTLATAFETTGLTDGVANEIALNGFKADRSDGRGPDWKIPN